MAAGCPGGPHPVDCIPEALWHSPLSYMCIYLFVFFTCFSLLVCKCHERSDFAFCSLLYPQCLEQCVDLLALHKYLVNEELNE